MKPLLLSAFRTISGLAFFVFYLYSGQPKCYAQNVKGTLESIYAAFKDREQNVNAAKFLIEEVITTPKGSITIPPGNKADKQGPFPSQTVINRRTVCLSFSRTGIRYSYEGPTWTNEVAGFLHQSYVSVYNGKDAKSFYAKAYGEHPLGFINKNYESHLDASNIHIQPVLRQFRALHISLGRISDAKLVIRPDDAEIDNRRCIVVEQNTPRSKEVFWLDPDRAFVILRSQNEVLGGKSLSQIDISYAQDGLHGWVPTDWRYSVNRSNGKSLVLQESALAKVVGFEINPVLNTEEFEITFPPDTLVEVNDNHKHSGGFIVREGGAKRVITRSERRPDVSYQDLLKSESGEASIASGSLIRVVQYTILACVALAILLHFVRKRWARVKNIPKSGD